MNSTVTRFFVSLTFLTGLLATSVPVYGQAIRENISTGLETITDEKVKATVSFLASDELAGRGTLTLGFEKAAQYVAQRFKKAGLKPGADGSYFHETPVAVTRTPNEGISISADGESIPTYELLSGGAEAVDDSLAWQRVGLRDELDSVKGIAVVELDTETGGQRWLAQLARLANRVRLAGGKALLLQVDEENPLRQLALQMQTIQPESERTRIMIPVLLIPKSALPEGKLKVELPAQVREEAAGKNVIAILPGSDPELAKEVVLFSAHLDHLPPNSRGDDRINNGADDNATGVTAVLCLAEAYAALPNPPARSVAFMTFWGEERGLLGSRAFAANPSIPLDSIVANINIEMIGRPEAGAQEKVWVTGWEKSNLGSLMAEAAQDVDVTVFEHPQFSAMLYARSDNYSFAEKGVIAHSFSAGSLHNDYHQPTDEWEKLDIEHMAQVIRGLLAGSFPIANGKQTPEKQTP